jgi:hypothetical protein
MDGWVVHGVFGRLNLSMHVCKRVLAGRDRVLSIGDTVL